MAAAISTLERDYARNPVPETLSAIRDLVSEHNETVDQEMLHCSRRSTASYYGKGGRPSHSLEPKLEAPRSQPYITELLDRDGVAHFSTREIGRVVLDFYSDLYGDRAQATAADIRTYLNDIALGWLPVDHREYLTQPFDVEDVKLAIMSLPICKAAGLDGLPSEFYKAYADDLAP